MYDETPESHHDELRPAMNMSSEFLMRRLMIMLTATSPAKYSRRTMRSRVPMRYLISLPKGLGRSTTCTYSRPKLSVTLTVTVLVGEDAFAQK